MPTYRQRSMVYIRQWRSSGKLPTHPSVGQRKPREKHHLNAKVSRGGRLIYDESSGAMQSSGRLLDSSLDVRVVVDDRELAGVGW